MTWKRNRLRRQEKAAHRNVTNACMGSFKDWLVKKANEYGRTITKVGRYFPSSQICSNCGYNAGKKDVDVRQWICPKCGIVLDRDVNAAINIRNEGRQILVAKANLESQKKDSA